MRENKSLKKLTLISMLALTSHLSVKAQQFSDSDSKLAQVAAQHFVNRMLERRDVGPLLKEFFSPDFIPYVACHNEQPPDFYNKLSRSERLRLFKLQINLGYLTSIDVIRGGSFVGDKVNSEAFNRVLPEAVAERLRKVLANPKSPLRFKDYQDFLIRVPKIESILTEARNYLKKNNVDHTLEFQKLLDNKITGKGLNYRVRVDENDTTEKICGSFGSFPLKQAIFRVETPIFLALLFVKNGNQMKIIFVDDFDDD